MALFSKEQPPPRPQSRIETAATGAAPSMTYFGRDVVVEGKVSGAEPVLIEGTVRGEINLGGDLRIGTQARVEATVHAKNVTVEGKLTGDVSADARVELVASATVDGNIKAPKIIVAEGARFRGAVDMGAARPNDEPDHTHHSKK